MKDTDKSEDTAASSKENDKLIELTFSHFFPTTHRVETEIVQGWIKEIEKSSGDRVRITSYPGETLLKSPETYQGIVDGVADIGLSCYAYTRGRFPVVEAFLLPGIHLNSSKVGSYAIMEGIERLNPKEIQDVKHLWTWSHGPGDFLMNTPIRKMEDLKGLEIGVTAGPRAEALELLGASAAVLPMPEWYESLERGVIKGGLASTELLEGFRLSEVTGEYVVFAPFLFNQLTFTVMNLDTWNSLPPDIQEIIMEVSEKFYAENCADLWDQINLSGIKFGMEIKDIEYIVLDDAETERWKAQIQPIIDKYIGFLDEKGIDGSKVMETVFELTDKYNEKYPDIAPWALYAMGQ